MTTIFLGQVGEDSVGGLLLDSLQASQVDISQVSKVPVSTGQAFVILLPHGENSIIILGGANMHWPQLSEAHKATIQTSSGVLLQREVPEEINLAAAQTAKASGKLVVMDAGGQDSPISAELLSAVDILSPNETELENLSGVAGDIEAAAQVLFERGVSHLLLKLGSQGSQFISKDLNVRVPAYQGSLPIVDTTGAGDTFTAAFTVKLLESPGVDAAHVTAAMEFASAAAYLTITQRGTITAMPSRAEVERLLTA
jgi:ribokinase